MTTDRNCLSLETTKNREQPIDEHCHRIPSSNHRRQQQAQTVSTIDSKKTNTSTTDDVFDDWRVPTQRGVTQRDVRGDVYIYLGLVLDRVIRK